jgi:hypothetical protein
MGAEPTDERTASALVGISSTVRGLLSSATRQDILTRHQAGMVLCDVIRAPETYGSGAIELIAMDLGVSPSFLRQHVVVAQCWSVAEMEALAERTTGYGHPLSWSHLVALTAVKGRKVRAAFAAEALANAWSVRELARRIEEHVARGAGETHAVGKSAIQTALDEGIQTGGRAIADVRTFGEAFLERLSEANEAVDEGLLDRVERTYETLRASVDATLDQIRAARGSKTRIRVEVPGAGEGEEEDAELADEPPSPTRAPRHRA